MRALTFKLQDRSFGVPIEPVREIIGLGEVTAVPMMPDFLHGVINLRGNVVPVLDLARRLGLARAVLSERSCVLMVECPSDDGTHLLGLLVDSVDEVLEFDSDELAAPPGFGTRVAPAFIAGLLQASGSALALLALERVLSLDELEQQIDEHAHVARPPHMRGEAGRGVHGLPGVAVHPGAARDVPGLDEIAPAAVSASSTRWPVA